MIFSEKQITNKKFLQQDPYWNAISQSNAIIEFTPDGTIISANENFINTMGYSLDELQGKHHQIFCTDDYKNSQEYSQFWQKLAQGHFFSSSFERITKLGDSIWLEATYNPVIKNNKVIKVIKIASDITEKKNFSNDNIFMINAINRSLATIEFNLDGFIINANDNFSKTMGYSLPEILGKHHKMFCSHTLANSQEYKNFWAELNRGNFQSGKFERFNKNGRSIWLEATYNPVFDNDGNIIKIIKIAKNITQEVTNVIHDENNADSVYKISKVATDISSSNKKNMDVVNSNTQEIQELMIEAEEMMQSLSKSIANITDLVETIKNISHQTHLLSINASIEAANAGPNGKGFSVVAQEVKRLSNITKASSDEIFSYIQSVQQATINTQNKIKQCAEKSSNVATKTTVAHQGLNQIESELNNLLNAVSNFSSLKHS